MPITDNPPRCWVITTGEAGMMSQALGVASAVGLEYEHKLATIPAPWRWFPGYLTIGLFAGARLNGSRPRPPWPDLLISCGRRSAIMSVAIRKASKGRTKTVHIQDPQISARHFDLVVPPMHDRMSGRNVLSTRGAVHRVTPDALEKGQHAFSDQLQSLNRPLVGVLLGGDSKAHRGEPERFAALGREIADAVGKCGGTAWITPSRRTGAAAIAGLQSGLQDARYCLWDGGGDNPYFAILGASDYLVVTSDSVSMVTEACATGKPVYVADLPGGTKRFQRFHDDMRREGATRPFTGELEPPWSYEPINDTPRVAAAIRSMLQTANA
jgi:uncharacterized protein